MYETDILNIREALRLEVLDDGGDVLLLDPDEDHTVLHDGLWDGQLREVVDRQIFLLALLFESASGVIRRIRVLVAVDLAALTTGVLDMRLILWLPLIFEKQAIADVALAPLRIDVDALHVRDRFKLRLWWPARHTHLNRVFPVEEFDARDLDEAAVDVVAALGKRPRDLLVLHRHIFGRLLALVHEAQGGLLLLGLLLRSIADKAELAALLELLLCLVRKPRHDDLEDVFGGVEFSWLQNRVIQQRLVVQEEISALFDQFG